MKNVISMQAKKAYEECSLFGRPLYVVCICIRCHVTLCRVYMHTMPCHFMSCVYAYDAMSLFSV